MKEVGHGQEESEEGKEVGEEEEESSRPEDGCEVRQARGRKAQGGIEKGLRAQEGGHAQARAPRDPDGGAAGAGGRYPGAGSLDRGHSRRQDGAEPGCGLAVSDGVPALMGWRVAADSP
ncbi:MAG TPA: hypothetical protein VFB01_03345 [Burkholderiales bacterium]|nr:hypothetical protein [Burkholderiales bacterium]